jgi:hypothetical protein
MTGSMNVMQQHRSTGNRRRPKRGTMFRRLAFLRMFVAAFALFYVAMSASAASACAMTDMDMSACSGAASGCDSHMSHDCQLACAAMCAAVEPSAVPVTIIKPIAQSYAMAPQQAFAAGHFGPEPPPPRMG